MTHEQKSAIDTRAIVLEVQGLTVGYVDDDDNVVVLVDSVSFTLREREVLGIVGESGSGKSVMMLAVLGLLPDPLFVLGGSVRFRGQELVGLSESALRKLRGKELAMVFQDPMTSLNPVKRVGPQIERALALHQKLSRKQRRSRVVELLEHVGVPQAADKSRGYPHEWSGGMRQRAVIAMAMANSAALLVADEPTTALDVTIQAQLMDVLAEARSESDGAMVLITHDLGLVAQHADRLAIMYSSRLVETGSVWDVFDDPKHPYTVGLLRSLLTSATVTTNGRAFAIAGSPPAPTARPSGCAFAPRCDFAGKTALCHEAVPPVVDIGPERSLACGPVSIQLSRATMEGVR